MLKEVEFNKDKFYTKIGKLNNLLDEFLNLYCKFDLKININLKTKYYGFRITKITICI